MGRIYRKGGIAQENYTALNDTTELTRQAGKLQARLQSRSTDMCYQSFL